MYARLLSSCIFASLVLAAARADDASDVILDRAIKTVGGAERIERGKVAQLKLKGTVHSPDHGALPFTAVGQIQLPDQFKHVMVYELNGGKITQTQVYQGENVAIRVNDRNMPLDAELRDSLMKGRYADQVTQLTMLKGKEYKLSALGESKVEGKPVLGIRVLAVGRPLMEMFFDKETGLLVKTEHKQMDPRTRMEVFQEVFYSDYRAAAATDDEQILKTAKIGTDAASLLGYFKDRSGGAEEEKILALIQQLGDDAFDKREQASASLVAVGAPAVPFLKKAVNDTDPEIARRAQQCLQKIGTGQEKKENPVLAAAVVRLLAQRKPEGAVAALLAYLPSAPDEDVSREVRAALTALAMRDGKPDPVLVKALDDKDALRRSAAAEALGRTPLPAGRKILLDGLQRPMKVAVYRAGRKFMEWQVTEVTYFNKLDDKMFSMP